MTAVTDRQKLQYIAAKAADARVNVELETEGMTLNIGPQHPATHGTLRIVARLDGEQVIAAQTLDLGGKPLRDGRLRGAGRRRQGSRRDAGLLHGVSQSLGKSRPIHRDIIYDEKHACIPRFRRLKSSA